ncbi:MAG: hypothetical protein ABS58_06950 [Mesorhizobium sp. SCN 65-20]|nr:MAG: hypothetical protein ABS58_06950 [Mesorhizobium sp. SCN 65-20]
MSATSTFLATTFLACLTINIPSIAAETPKLQPINISKECSKYTGETPSFCTIVESDFKEIPVGTDVLYYGPMLNSPLFSSSSVVLAVGPGNTAVGHCIVYDTASPPTGHCAFSAGSGTLAGFQAILNVTVDAKQIWHWEGGYHIAAPAK